MAGKKTGIVVLLIIAALIACGCGQSEHNIVQKNRKFGFSAMDLTDPAFRAAKTELEIIVNEKGDELISADGKLDNDVQIAGIEEMIAQGIEVLFLNPVDGEAIEPALKKCREAGVKVICFDSKVNAVEYIETFVGGDNYKLGLMIGERIKDDYPDGAVLGVFSNPLANSVKDRVKGLEDSLKKSKIKLLYGKDVTTYDDALPAAHDLLANHPEVNVIWGFNDDLCLMIHSSVVEAGKEDSIEIYGTGGHESIVSAIKGGKVRAVSAQNYGDWGKTCGELCYKMLAGDKLEPSYFIKSFIIDRENASEYEN